LNHSNAVALFVPLDPHSKSIHTPSTMINITPQQLRKAADLQEKIQSLQKELGQLLGGEISTPAQPTKVAKKKRKMSAAGKAAIRAAQKARWAKIKTAKAPKKRKPSAQGLTNIRAGVAKRMAAKGKPVKKARRKMSPAAKAKMAALMKARWAQAKRAGKSKL
jgi:hypothetical protein